MISLGNYVDFNNIRPVQNPLDTGPSVGSMISQGINEVTNTLDEQVQKQNDAKFAIESVKFKNERDTYANELDKQIQAGNLTDVDAKQKMLDFDNQLTTRYSSVIPKSHLERLNQLTQLEQLRVNKGLEDSYQKYDTNKFYTGVQEVYVHLSKEPNKPLAYAQMSAVLSDPRIPEDKRIETMNKFKAEYDTNSYNERINNSQDDNSKLYLIRQELEVEDGIPNPNIANLTQEQVVAYRDMIDGQIARNNELARRKQEQDARLAQEAKDKLTKSFIDQVNSIYPIDQQTLNDMRTINPELYKAGVQVKEFYKTYQFMTSDQRQQERDRIQKDMEQGKSRYDLLGGNAEVLRTIQAIDAETDRREKTDPVGTFNQMYGANLDPNKKSDIVTALETNGKPIIPYTESELRNIKRNWTNPTNRTLILGEFLNNASGAKDPNKALFDQIDAVAPRDQIPKYIMYARLNHLSVATFDVDGNVVSPPKDSQPLSITQALIMGDDSNTSVGKQFNQEIEDLPELEQKAMRSMYKYVLDNSNGTLINKDKDGKIIFNEQAYERAKTILYGQKLTTDDKWGPNEWYYKQRGDRPEIRLPIGMTNTEARERIKSTVDNYVQFTGLAQHVVASHDLIEVPDRPGVYMYVNAKDQPLLYGYTNKDGSDMSRTKSDEFSIPVPLIIDLNQDKPVQVSNERLEKFKTKIQK